MATICDALKLARHLGKAIRREAWEPGVFAYHGMDNHLFVKNPHSDGPDCELSMAVATLLQEDWVVCYEPYNGPLSTERAEMVDHLIPGE